MKNKLKIALFIGLIFAQIIINRYVQTTKLNIDCLFLILVYISIQSGLIKSLIWGTFIGWVTDFFIGGLVGVFGFSRTITAFFLHEFNKFFDLRKNIFVFLLIAISLAFSNLIASVFLHFIFGYKIEISLVLRQPLLTGLTGMLISSFSKIKKILDVH
ncbi:MAG: rod shape-determining protein MreD [Candidatus Aminicenantes bacterium]|nr:rod shape-determining protein MreD [Candidatus Aminicenantes bacterium]